MYIAFLNPQGNFDKNDSFWTEHPDFGGQLVYVKEIAIAMSLLGHTVDIITRQIHDNKFNVFSNKFDEYLGYRNVRIVRIPCGPKEFINKEQLWEHLEEWTENIVKFFKEQEMKPDFITGHYGDGGLAATMLKQKLNIPYSFTGHSLGAQKLDKLRLKGENLETLEKKYHFAKRIEAERTAIKYANIIFVSTVQEQHQQYNHIFYKDITKNMQDQFVVAPPGANTKVFSSSDQDFDLEYYSKFIEICNRDIKKNRIDLPYIISASRLDDKKNHLGLVKAYASDKKLQKQANLAISVRGVDNVFIDYSNLKEQEKVIIEEILEIINKAKLKGKVTFISINSQLELASFYRFMARKKSVFTLTALYEPFGLAPIEAMSAGLPAVVTKYGGPADVLEENNTKFGVLVDVHDEKQIAEGLKEALDNFSYYQSLGIERVHSKYTWLSTAKTYANQIEKVLNHTKSDDEINIHDFFSKPSSINIDLEFIKNKIRETEN